MSVNKVILLGRLGQDPELKYTPSGTSVCNFTMATSENWTDRNGQKQERTEWHRIVVWGKLGELCNQYLSKGRQVFLEGKLQTRSWDDQDGKKRYMTEVQALSVQFIGGQAQQGHQGYAGDESRESAPQQQAPTYDVSTDSNFTADDIPF